MTKRHNLRSQTGSAVLMAVGAALLLAAPAARADVVLGIFTTDDQMRIIPFTMSSNSLATFATTSFADGSNGFAPVLSLFDASGTQPLLAFDHNGGPGPGCGARATDAATGYCWDAYISIVLGPGAYVLTLTEDDNYPLGPGFADGFQRQGQGDFSGPNFTGGAGRFYLVTGQQRTGQYSVMVTGTDPLATPEPDSIVMAGLGVGLLLLAGRRSRRRPIRPLPAR